MRRRHAVERLPATQCRAVRGRAVRLPRAQPAPHALARPIPRCAGRSISAFARRPGARAERGGDVCTWRSSSEQWRRSPGGTGGTLGGTFWAAVGKFGQPSQNIFFHFRRVMPLFHLRCMVCAVIYSLWYRTNFDLADCWSGQAFTRNLGSIMPIRE